MGFEIFLVVITWLYVRTLYAIELAYAHRGGILSGIHNIGEPSTAIDKLNLLRDVPFGSHVWRLATFRSPWSLYPAGLADEVRVMR